MKRLLTLLLLLSTSLFTIHARSALAQTNSQCPSLESVVFPPEQRKKLVAQVSEQLNSQGIAGNTEFVVAIGSYGVGNWWNPMTRTMLVSVVAFEMKSDRVYATAINSAAGDTVSQLVARGYPSGVAECLLQLLNQSY